MAINAVTRRVAEDMRLVADQAFHFAVCAEKRESRQAVIEEHVVRPGDFAMAVLAPIAQRAAVRVILRMAGIAA